MPTSTAPAADPLRSWLEFINGSSFWAGPSNSADPLFGVRGDGGPNVEIATWDGRSWTTAQLLEIEATEGLDAMWVADVTGDGSEEVGVTYWGGSDLWGEIFVRRADGLFRSAPIDDGGFSIVPRGTIPNMSNANGVAEGIVETCEPDCATGALLNVSYRWTGSAFIATEPRCAEYEEVDAYDDVGICTKGDVVRSIQSILASEGYMPSGAADGYFGLLTRQAVVEFQRDNPSYLPPWGEGWFDSRAVFDLGESQTDWDNL